MLQGPEKAARWVYPQQVKIVARTMVIRACGHKQEFQHFKADKYRAQQCKVRGQSLSCLRCQKLQEEQRGLWGPAEEG